MIARRCQRILKSRKDAVACVADRRELAMHDAAGAHDAAAEGLADCLMAEAYPQDRNRVREALNQRHRAPGFGPRAGPGRECYLLRLPRRNLCERDCSRAIRG